jgi:hypothetical protein
VIVHKIECFGHRRKKRFGSARVKAAHFQASNDACDASNPFFSIDKMLINSDEVWISPMLSKWREKIMRAGGERVLQCPYNHWTWGGFAYEWRRSPSAC